MSESAPIPDDRPKLRPLDIIPVQVRGQQAFLLRDPQRLSPAQVTVPPDIIYLLSNFDGAHTVREAQVAYVRRFGALLTTDKIAQLLQQLDEALFLDTERFRKFRSQLEAEFRARPTRAAAHAGQSYPEGAAAFAAAWRPRLEATSLPQDFALDQVRPALIVPHYDMNASGECYSAAYGLLRRVEPPDVVVILGIAHSGGSLPFALTGKPYETPFGALEADDHIISELEKAAPFDFYADEFLHRDEHSVEFQAVLLHFLYREQPEPPRIVPILCGSYHRENGRPADASRPGPAAQFLDLLREVMAADSRRVAVIASADLSHIGARFGQPPANPVQMELSRRHDMALLERAQAGDADGLYQALAREDDRYNVCGFPAIYALLRALPIEDGRLLSYRQATEPQTQSCVSFASVGLH
jgi:hypothetical protein